MTKLNLNKIVVYLPFLKRAFAASLKLGMPPWEMIRYLAAVTKNARYQIGFPENFLLNRKINRFKTNMGWVYFRDNHVDPATLTELVENQYEFSKLSNDGTYVDIGGGIGMAAKLFSFYNPKCKIFCFEPVAENAELIKLNCSKSRVYTCAIGKNRSRLVFHIHPISSMAFKDEINAGSRRTMEVFPLDFFVEKFGKRIGMLKIDTEGSEVDILSGGQKILDRTNEVRMETHSAELHEQAKEILIKNRFIIHKEAINKSGYGYIFAKKKVD